MWIYVNNMSMLLYVSFYELDSMFDSDLLNKMIYCCIKDKFVKELSLTTLGRRYTYPNLFTLTAKAIQTNKSLAKIRIVYSTIGINEALAINDCLKVGTLKELIISKCNLN